MDRLWSPWRSVHVTGWNDRPAEERGSVFERLAASDDDEGDLVVWRGKEVFVMMNLYPYNNGHVMIAPYRKVAAYEDLTSSEQMEIATTLDRCLRWLRAALSPDGFNVGMNLGAAAGAAIPDHLHLHIVPRWNGDTSFMASTADVRVIPEAIRDTYRRIRHVVESDD